MVVGEYRDRLARRGVAYLEAFRHAVGVRVIVREHTVKDDPHDLVDEWIAITTAACAQIDGTRGGTKLAATGRQAMAT